MVCHLTLCFLLKFLKCLLVLKLPTSLKIQPKNSRFWNLIPKPCTEELKEMVLICHYIYTYVKRQNTQKYFQFKIGKFSLNLPLFVLKDICDVSSCSDKCLERKKIHFNIISYSELMFSISIWLDYHISALLLLVSK